MSYSRAKELKKELKHEELTQAFSVPTAYALEVLRQLLLWECQTGFQRHRGWRSKKARNNYVDESLDSLLLVSQSMLQQ